MRAYDQSLWTVLGGVHFLTRKGREWAYVRGAGLCHEGWEAERTGELLRAVADSGVHDPLVGASRYALRLIHESGLVDARGLSSDGYDADARGRAHEERILAAIAESHPIGPDGKPTSLVRTVDGGAEWSPDVPLTGDTGPMVAPDSYRETCVSVAAGGEIGAGSATAPEQIPACRCSRRMDERIAKALGIAIELGGIDGAHHKAWVIDQMARALAGDEYASIVAMVVDGGGEWDVGIAP